MNNRLRKATEILAIASLAACALLACEVAMSAAGMLTEGLPPAPTNEVIPASIGASTATPVATSTQRSTSELDRLLEIEIPELMEAYGVPGVAVALIDKGEVVWAQGYGLADTANGTPVTEDTVFQAASISKPVTAWGVMSLVEQGLLDLDAPVEQYLTRWHLPPSDFDHDKVTISRLLSHTAGLSLHGYPGFEPDQSLPTLEESLSGATNGAADVRVVQAPGLEWAYSGGGYTLLQLAVEEVSGQTFVDFLEHEVLARLGMMHSSFEWTPELQSTTATAYDEFGDPLPNYLFTAKAAAGLYTTASDLARFVAAGLSGPMGEEAGRGVLSPETVKLMFSPAVKLMSSCGPSARGGSFGLGYCIGRLSDGTRFVSHGGDNSGWHAGFAAMPKRGEGIVILTNSDADADLRGYVIEAYLDLVAEEVESEPLPPTTTITYDFTDFAAIAVSSPFGVTIEQGDVFSVEVMVDAGVANNLDIRQDGTKLIIDLSDTPPDAPLIRTMKARVTMPKLEEVALSAASHGRISGFSASDLKLSLQGASSLEGNGITLDNLWADISGASMLKIGYGRVGNLKAKVLGVSNLELRDVDGLATANAVITDASHANLNIDIGGTLSGSLTGVSSLSYYGTNVAEDVTKDTLSNLVRLGDTRVYHQSY